MKNNSQKGFVVPLVIAIVVLVLGGSYVYYKTQSKSVKGESVPASNIPQNNLAKFGPGDGPYSDWKTYTNTDYGFQVSYPSDWAVKVGTNYGGGIQDKGEVQFAIVKQNNPTSIEDLHAITFTVKPAKYASNDQLLVAKQNEISSNPHVKNIWNVTQSNFLNMGKAVLVSEDETKVTTPVGCVPTGTLSESVFIVKTPNMFTFSDYRCFDKQVQQIMNTFKFIPTSVTDSNIKPATVVTSIDAYNPAYGSYGIESGSQVKVMGTNLGYCDLGKVQGCDISVHVDENKRGVIKRTNSDQTMLIIQLPNISPGTHSLYLEFPATGKISNSLNFTIIQ